MFLARLLVATVFATCAAVASSDEIEVAYDAGRYADALAMLESRGLEGDGDALNDSAQAIFILAQLYQQGIGVPLDSDRANWWLTRLAANSFSFTIAPVAER